MANISTEGTAQPTSSTLRITPQNLGGHHIPPAISQQVGLAHAPKPGNLNLSDVLTVALQHKHIYIAHPNNPLSNNLELTFTNTGQAPLSSVGPGNARVTVSFVYGSTAGSIAPLNSSNPSTPGSAWNIKVAPDSLQGNAWSTQNPSPVLLAANESASTPD